MIIVIWTFFAAYTFMIVSLHDRCLKLALHILNSSMHSAPVYGICWLLFRFRMLLWSRWENFFKYTPANKSWDLGWLNALFSCPQQFLNQHTCSDLLSITLILLDLELMDNVTFSTENKKRLAKKNYRSPRFCFIFVFFNTSLLTVLLPEIFLFFLCMKLFVIFDKT